MRLRYLLLLAAAGCYVPPAVPEAKPPPKPRMPCDWVPADAGAPVDFQLETGTHSEPTDVLEDGEGGFAVEVWNYSGNWRDEFTTYAPDGSEVVTTMSDRRATFAQPHGFSGVSAFGSNIELFSSLGGEASWRWAGGSANCARLSAAWDPNGGTALAWVAQWSLSNRAELEFASFDQAGGQRAAELIIAEGAGEGLDPVLLGTTIAGNSLALYGKPFAADMIKGRWITRTGAPGEPFALDISARLPEDYDATAGNKNVLAPLLDGSLALRIGGTWVGTIESGRAELEPAPDWLANASNEELAIVAGGRGYAIFSPDIGAGVCRQPIKLVDKSGIACRTLEVATSTSACGPGTLSVGKAGTVFALLPPEGRSSGYIQTTVRRWPGLLH